MLIASTIDKDNVYYFVYNGCQPVHINILMTKADWILTGSVLPVHELLY